MASPKSILEKWGPLGCIIALNVIVLIALRISFVCGFYDILNIFLLPPTFTAVLFRPWTLLTYMVAQYEVLHLVPNMLLLYWIGSMFVSLYSSRRLVALYVVGGLVGAAFYLITAALFPAHVGLGLVGSSAAVLSVIVAAAVMMPHYEMRLWLLGDVELRWVALGVLALMVLSALTSSVGALMAHIGGVAAGASMAVYWRYFKTRRKVTASTPVDLGNLDPILDKVKRSGYASLSNKERRQLFEISQHLNRRK